MNAGRPIGEDDLNAYVDGALDGRRRAEVDLFLDAHPDIRDRVSKDLAARDAMRGAYGPIAEEPVPSEFDLGRLIAARGQPSRAGLRASWQAAAAAVLLIIGGSGGWLLHGSHEAPSAGIGALAQEATETYAVYAPETVRPVEIPASDMPQLIAWASRRLARPVAAPDLSSSGYRLLGGRVVPTPHGPAVLYMYANEAGTRLTLLSRNMKVDRDAPMAVNAAGAMTSVTWSRDGLGFSLVGPLGGDALHPIADVARAQLDQAV